MYKNVELFVDGTWRPADDRGVLPVLNPATEEEIGTVARAASPDLDQALEAAARGYRAWKRVSAFDRSKVLRRAASLFRERAEDIAALLTLEQGKPLAEARLEVLNSADMIDWFAEEARRTYGRVIPSRGEGVYQLVVKEPVGPVAAFTPWNFPVSQSARKISAALAAGCSIILKGPEEAPAACAKLVGAFADAGVPAGALNLVYGTPHEISEGLIPDPVIRKVSFTGSTAVGKRLAELAGRHMKRTTMELGGHAPAIVFDDADIDEAARLLSWSKYRNAGQVCIAPTRFLVQEAVYDRFLDRFVAAAESLRLGDGLAKDTQMGPLAHARRLEAMHTFLGDARQKGATLRTGGERVGNKGYFFSPTVMTDVPNEALIMNEEPFGPLAIVRPFREFDEAIAEANRLAYGLAAYAYTRSTRTAQAVAASLENGLVSINHHGLGLPEVPHGGVKESGYGSEGGLEAMESYLVTKFVSQAGV